MGGGGDEEEGGEGGGGGGVEEEVWGREVVMGWEVGFLFGSWYQLKCGNLLIII